MDPPKEQDPEPEIIAGQPTLHETPPVARLADIMPTGCPDWANYDGAVDERTGVPLLEDKVKEGRGREMKRARWNPTMSRQTLRGSKPRTWA